MSIQAVSFVLDSDVPEVAAKMLLVCLANAHNNETGLCCPSVARLADESSMSRRSVQRWLKWLADEGYIEVIERADNGRQQANEYRIAGFVRGAKLTPSPRGRGDTADTGEGDTGDTGEGDTVGTPLKKPEDNQKKEREQASARVSFDDAWKAFPHRPQPNRTAAQEAWAELSDPETHRAYVGVQRFARWHIEDSEDRKETPESQLGFRPGMGKWLRTGGWVEALSVVLRIDPVAGKSEVLVVLDAASPEVRAIERIRGKSIYVGASGKVTVTQSELEQARTAA